MLSQRNNVWPTISPVDRQTGVQTYYPEILRYHRGGRWSWVPIVSLIKVLKKVNLYNSFCIFHLSLHRTLAVFDCTKDQAIQPLGRTCTKRGGSAKQLNFVWMLVTWGILLYSLKVLCPHVMPSNQQGTWDLLYVVEVVDSTIPGHIFAAVPFLLLVVLERRNRYQAI